MLQSNSLEINCQPSSPPFMAKPASTQGDAGLLEVPASWLHELVLILPADSRFCLYSTCWQLARQVMLSAPNVQLVMGRQDPMDIMLSSSNINKVLAVRKDLELHVRERGPQPFPVDASSKVTELVFKCLEQGPPSVWFSRSNFSNLQHLCFRVTVSQADLDGLCHALWAGHLQQLRKLTDETREGIAYAAYGPTGLNIRPVMLAFGSRLTHIVVSSESLISYLHELPALQTVVVRCTVRSNGFTALCKHPTLKTVHFTCGLELAHDHSSEPCSLHLKMMAIDTVTLQSLSRLPFASLQEIHVHSGISCATSDLNALSALNRITLDKVFLLPTMSAGGKLGFYAADITVGTISILSRLQSDCWLAIAPHERELVPALWKHVHPSVSGVDFGPMSDLDWKNFWDGIPESILNVELPRPDFMDDLHGQRCKCNTDLDTLCSLVSGTPLHVRSLKFVGVCTQFWAGVQAAKLRRAAPAHLLFELVCRRV